MERRLEAPKLLLGPSPTWVYPTSPSRDQAPLGGVPGAESSCLFKRPRGAPRKPPGAGGGRARAGAAGARRPRLHNKAPAPVTSHRPGPADGRGTRAQLPLPLPDSPGPGRRTGAGLPASRGWLLALGALRASRNKEIGRGRPGPGGALVPSPAGPPVRPWPRSMSRGQGPLLGPSPSWASPVSLLCVTGRGSACARVDGLGIYGRVAEGTGVG